MADALSRLAELDDDELDALIEIAEARASGAITRRGLLKAAGGIGAAGLVGGAVSGSAAADASTSDSDGNIGRPSDRIDVFADGVDATSVSTNEAEIKSIPGWAVFATHPDFATVQDAHDAITTSSGIATQSLQVGAGIGEVTETVDISKTGLKVNFGGGTYPHIVGSGDHTIDIQAQDTTIEGGWVDQTGTGSWDAVHVDGTETVIRDLDIDDAPRYGLNVLGGRCETSIQVAGDGGATACARTAGGKGRHGWILRPGAGHGGDGAIVDGDINILDIYADNIGGDGVVVNGTGNVIRQVSFGSGGDGLVIDGTGNVILGRIDGQITLTSNSSDNVVVGWSGQSPTDNGTGNDTSVVVS